MLIPRLVVIILLLALAVPGAALSQPAPAPGPAPAPALAPAEAQQVLDVLRDDKRRAEFTAVLESMVRATPAPVASPSLILPLEPDSLGAQVIDQAAATLAKTGAQLAASARAVNDLPLLWRWVATQADSAEFRARALDALWKIAVAIGAALLIELVVIRLLRRMRAALSALAPPAADPDILADAAPPESGLEAAEAGETERSERTRRLSLAMGTLRRLPYLLGRLLLDLAPIAAFAATATLLLGTRLGEPPTVRLAIQLVLNGYVLGRTVLSVASMLVSPGIPRLRLLNVSDFAAAFLTRWVRVILIVVLTGYVVTQVGLLFGMYRTAHDALQKLFSLVVHGCLAAAVLQARPSVAARLRGLSRSQGFSAGLLNRLAEGWHLIAIFLIMALWLVYAAELRNGYSRLITFTLVTFGVLIAARLVAVVLLGGLDRVLRPPDAAAAQPGWAARAGVYQPVLRAALIVTLSALTGVALLEAWRLGPVEWLIRNGLGGRVVSAATTIAVTVTLAVVVWEGANAAFDRHLAHLAAGSHLARAGRIRTLLPLARTTLLVAIVLVVALMVLSELGINIAPLLAGAGVIGIAVGFGSQRLVQDLITGLFLLLENSMQVGDVVTLGGLTGTVEALSIRTIRLRALDGAVHIIPFSAVTTVTNQTRDYGYALLDISVGLNEEPARIIPIVQALAAEMRRDPQWATLVVDDLDVMGVEKFIDTAWVLRVRMKTQPASRWKVGRELNRRVKLRFDELAVESPLTSYRALSAPPAPDVADVEARAA